MVKPTLHQPDRHPGQSSKSPDRRAARDSSKQDLSQVLPAIWEAETIEQAIQAALEAIRAEFGYTLL